MNVLFVTARFPYPPLKGDQVIPYNRLKLLGRKHRITLLSFYQHDAELKFLDSLRPYCEEIITIKQSQAESVFNMLKGLYLRLPFQVLYFRSKKMRQAIQALTARKDFDIVHAYMIRMADYVRNSNVPRVLDLIDPMHVNYQRRAITDRYWLRPAFRIESRRLKLYEEDITGRYDASILVSEKDRDVFASEKVTAVSLGVDTDLYRHNGELPDNKTIVFSGNMGYGPNNIAIHWFMKNCFDTIRKQVTDAKLLIVGDRPSSQVRAFHDGISIHVTGFVPSMPDVLRKAQLAVAPMQSGYGMHIKLLEAMACGLPVVSTTAAMGTIKAVNGKEIAIADDAATFAQRCIDLLVNHDTAKKMGSAAREITVSRYSWETHADRIDAIYSRIIRKTEG